jgi:hypothetical protein
VLVSAAAATVVFLIMIQGAFHEGFTELDYSHVLGTAIKGTAVDEATAGALGIVGDTAGPTGLYATFVAAVVLVAFHGLVVTRLVRRGWVVQGLALGAVVALVVGLVFCGYAGARLDTPIGLFGADAGGIAPVAIVISSLGFGLVAARCYGLMTSAGWWEVHTIDEAAVIESVSELEPADESLELAEEGPEQRRVGA